LPTCRHPESPRRGDLRSANQQKHAFATMAAAPLDLRDAYGIDV
jgi:hypothetical protein